MQYLLGIDIGTSSCKTALFGEDGVLIASASQAYPVRYPHPGWAEQNPEDWWNAVVQAIRETLEKSGVKPSCVAGIGIDGQSWSAIPVDREGSVLAPTPIWTDSRAQEECGDMRAAVPGEEWYRVSGNPISPSYTLPKVLWMKKHMPQVYEKTAYILQSNSYIIFRLTGKITQDKSQGYGWACFDMKTGAWNLDLLKAIGINKNVLPDLFECHEIVGNVDQEAARATGLPCGIPVVAGGLDAACGSLGAGVLHNGQTQEQGGQAGGMSICLDECKPHPALIISRHVVKDKWLLQGGTTGGAGTVKWLREELFPDKAFSTLTELAGCAEAGSEGLLFLPYMAGERSPIWNSNAKGVFFGLDYSKNASHMIRSVMEGVAFSLRHNLETAEEVNAAAGILRSVGGSTNSDVWMQIKADVTGHSLEVPNGDHATTFGAAILAGVGTGVFSSFDEAVGKIKVTRRYEPRTEQHKKYDQCYAVYRKLSDTLLPLMK